MSTDSSFPKQSVTAPLSSVSTLLQQGDYAAALSRLQQISESERQIDDWVNQAVCLIHLNQAEAALEACDRALTLAPEHPQAWLFKGVACHRLQQYDAAYACYDQALGKGQASPKAATVMKTWRQQVAALRSFAKHVKETRLLRLWLN
ncbi:MAG: tetratricopeptide repeat protein [Cyanobacteria bacterium P01_H01_bin.162]